MIWSIKLEFILTILWTPFTIFDCERRSQFSIVNVGATPRSQPMWEKYFSFEAITAELPPIGPDPNLAENALTFASLINDGQTQELLVPNRLVLHFL